MSHQLEPFPARIVRAEWAEHVVSPMHDSLTAEERAAMLAERPYSWLHVSRTPDDLPEHGDEEALIEVETAALGRLLDAGVFEDFPEPDLYVYRLRTADHVQTGIVGEVPHEAFVEGRVLGHEGVQRDRVDALELHLGRVGAASTLVALMFRAADDVRKLVDAATEEEPLRSFGADGLDQTVWRFADPDAIERIRERIDRQVLYITDGHHRATASVELWEQQGRPAGGVPAALFPDDELRMLPFHRRVVGPLSMSPRHLLSSLGERVRVEPGEPAIGQRGAVGLYTDGAWHQLAFHPDGSEGGVEALDVTRLHREILEPVFGIPPTGDPSLEFVSAAVPREELLRRVDADRGAAFTLVAPTFEQFVEVADRNEQMPPKATFFDPKPRAGLFLRMRED